MFINRAMIVTVVVMLMAFGVSAFGNTNGIPPMSPKFLKTNGEFVVIGNLMVKTNSPLNTDSFKQYKWRVYLLDKIMNSDATNRQEKLVEGAWALQKDYPDRPNGYELIMAVMDEYGEEGNLPAARALAKELSESSAPERFKTWSKGFLNRMDSFGKPVAMQFTAVDGRQVNLADMRGKVVLVDFWSTGCGPCVAELPRIKEAYEKFHRQGLEVIGISCDTDQSQLQQFVKEKGYSWPQYFDGRQQEENKFAQGFGIDGIPHMFLVDKKGILRFDNVRANDALHERVDQNTFEEKISALLAED
jgi:peroxiredoxin